jgi:hypothetical protein
MTKNIMLAASMMMLVAIPGQAFARAAGSTEQHGPEATRASAPQAMDSFHPLEPAMATQAATPNTQHYHGGPKSND